MQEVVEKSTFEVDEDPSDKSDSNDSQDELNTGKDESSALNNSVEDA